MHGSSFLRMVSVLSPMVPVFCAGCSHVTAWEDVRRIRANMPRARLVVNLREEFNYDALSDVYFQQRPQAKQGPVETTIKLEFDGKKYRNHKGVGEGDSRATILRITLNPVLCRGRIPPHGRTSVGGGKRPSKSLCRGRKSPPSLSKDREEAPEARASYRRAPAPHDGGETNPALTNLIWEAEEDCRFEEAAALRLKQAEGACV